VVAVGGAHDEMHLLAERRTFGLVLFDHLLQELFTGDREDDLAHGLIGTPHGSFGNPVEDALFVPYPLKLIEKLLLDPLLGSYINFVDDVNEQID
jgi:hypothetical protein